MSDKSILLCCGAGISSGLIAQKARKEARKNGLNYSIQAVSQSEVTQYLGSIDMLLVGPHYANIIEKLTAQAKPFNVPVALIPNEVYGTLDGKAVLDIIQAEIAK